MPTFSYGCRHFTDDSALTSSNQPVVPMVSITLLRALQATIVFATHTMHIDASTVRKKHLPLRRGSRRARRDICYGTLPIQKLADASDNLKFSQSRQKYRWSFPLWTRIRHDLTLATIKHLGSCLSGENKCIPVCWETKFHAHSPRQL